MTDREIRQRFDGIDKRFEGMDRRLDRMATVDVVTSEMGHVRDKVADVDRNSRERDEELGRDWRERHDDMKKEVVDVKKGVAATNKRIDERGNNTWTRVIAVAGIAVSLLVGVLAAYISSKGIK